MILPAVDDNRAGSASVTFIHLPEKQDKRDNKERRTKDRNSCFIYELIIYKCVAEVIKYEEKNKGKYQEWDCGSVCVKEKVIATRIAVSD